MLFPPVNSLPRLTGRARYPSWTTRIDAAAPSSCEHSENSVEMGTVDVTFGDSLSDRLQVLDVGHRVHLLNVLWPDGAQAEVGETLFAELGVVAHVGEHAVARQSEPIAAVAVVNEVTDLPVDRGTVTATSEHPAQQVLLVECRRHQRCR